MFVDDVSVVGDIGPRTEFGKTIHRMKYRAPEETFDDYAVRYARATSGNNDRLFRRALYYLREQAILPAGRQQLSVGRDYQTTGFNCFVLGVIPDDTSGIFDSVKESALTLRAGGGIGLDFSTLRPHGDRVRGLGHGAYASGPVSFMGVWNEMCRTVMSAGERRGAMMATLRCDHPDVMRFVKAKQSQGNLTNFNISLMVTDEFMEALDCDGLYTLRFNGTPYRDMRAQDVWGEVMSSTWDWAEPGVIFIDRVNRINPLNYCEKIHSTNPCAEKPMPPYGACLLGSLNITKFLTGSTQYEIDFASLEDAVDVAVRLFDSVIDSSNFPLPQQRAEALAKRRMGVGVTGVANALEICGFPYASEGYLAMQDRVLQTILVRAYRTSIELARENGPFPLWDSEKHMAGEFVCTRLPEDVQYDMRRHGLRNGLLTSIAPTGTISMAADNVSSGIEPVFALNGRRMIFTPEGQKEFDVRDYAKKFFGVEGRTANDVNADEHADVLCRAQHWVDAAISKTINVAGQVGGSGPGTTFAQFQDVYLRVYKNGGKSCSTFNLSGKRMGIMTAVEQQSAAEGAACFIDPETGVRSCGD